LRTEPFEPAEPFEPTDPFDAIVLAGARSERLGGVDKAMIEIDGSTLLDRVLRGLGGASRVVVVGPPRPIRSDVSINWCEEQPAGGGPVAAFAAGLAATSADVVVLLASDLPFVAGAAPALRAALVDGIEVALLVDAAGRANYLAGAWRRGPVLARLAALGPPSGMSMRALIAGLATADVVDRDGCGLDCDTWEAVAVARSVIETTEESHAG
jgi:molybdopterin-guanine dinucleotide biosynthesis protein A